jgi:hypothetical protein
VHGGGWVRRPACRGCIHVYGCQLGEARHTLGPFQPFPCTSTAHSRNLPLHPTRCFLCLQSAPATSRPCNRFPCPADVTAWSVGPWGACNVTEPCGINLLGSQQRVVTCISFSSGTAREDGACGAQPRPGSIQPCAVTTPCTCATDSQCGGTPGHRVCHGTCGCAPGWGDAACSTPLLLGATPCTDGVVDTSGHCCVWFIDASTGLCCPDGVPVDAWGRCCVSGSIDACGVCDGTGVAVDAQGTCCRSPLPPSGVCCDTGLVDSCGVCGGDNRCR